MRKIIDCDWSILTITTTYDYVYAIIESTLDYVLSPFYNTSYVDVVVGHKP